MLASYTKEKNLSINGAYTSGGNGVAPQDQYNLRVEKAISIQDVPQTLNVVYTWDLPLGRGRRYLSGSNTFVRAHRWRLDDRGTPAISLRAADSHHAPVNTLGAGVLYTPQLRASTTGASIQTGANRTTLDPNNPNTRWLNRAAFAVPGALQFGTASPYLNDVRNPPVLSESLSLVKRTSIKSAPIWSIGPIYQTCSIGRHLVRSTSI